MHQNVPQICLTFPAIIHNRKKNLGKIEVNWRRKKKHQFCSPALCQFFALGLEFDIWRFRVVKVMLKIWRIVCNVFNPFWKVICLVMLTLFTKSQLSMNLFSFKRSDRRQLAQTIALFTFSFARSFPVPFIKNNLRTSQNKKNNTITRKTG